ncbi:hypothetical protein Gohar_024709 [Gossypium harknessii]|uniref:Uncharacterized protein n=1 Tax=Gossypium harknessii TaxID=34285 RepID=A0A7J9HGQ2_9ROSI|nr:hypothetical protein [Gossypium harknessii]
MTRVLAKRKQCNLWKYNYGPLIKKKFNDSKKEGVDWKMIWNGENGIPCPHVCCAIWHIE